MGFFEFANIAHIPTLYCPCSSCFVHLFLTFSHIITVFPLFCFLALYTLVSLEGVSPTELQSYGVTAEIVDDSDDEAC